MAATHLMLEANQDPHEDLVFERHWQSASRQHSQAVGHADCAIQPIAWMQLIFLLASPAPDSASQQVLKNVYDRRCDAGVVSRRRPWVSRARVGCCKGGVGGTCLLYTSDAADDM
eukprot:3143412-Alexandrium_andersonii.AAC.1